MPRNVSPQRWQRYVGYLREGWGRSDARRMAGISKTATAAFHRGDASSSGVRWLLLQASADLLPDTEPCRRCGHIDGLDEVGDAIARIGAPIPRPRDRAGAN